MTPAARAKLEKVLARLSSGHDGEVLNAARLVVKLLAAEGKRPEELLAMGAPAWSVGGDVSRGTGPTRATRDLAQEAAALLDRRPAFEFTKWEHEFLGSIASRPLRRIWSSRQAAAMDRIKDKYGAT